MKILVVGSGGREHAIVRALAGSRYNPELFAAPGNGGISALARCLPVKATDIDGVLRAVTDFAIDLVFVDRGGRVVRIVANVRPERFCVWGGWRAAHVIESEAGKLDLARLRVGDELLF